MTRNPKVKLPSRVKNPLAENNRFFLEEKIGKENFVENSVNEKFRNKNQ